MIHPIDLNQTHALRDSAGNIVGYLLPAGEYEVRLQPVNGAATGQTPREDAEVKCRQLAEECDRLRMELETTRKERDDFRRSTYALLRDHPKYNEPLHFTKEEVLAARVQHPTFEELVAQIEQEARGESHA